MQACLVALMIVLPSQVKETEDGPISKDKWKSDYTEKIWGLKIKTVKYTLNQLPPDTFVILEFTKDLKPEEVKACKDVFDRKEGNLEFCFFDEDGVIIAKATFMNYAVQGDISGKKDDAIRCRISMNRSSPVHFLTFPEQAKKIKRVELRLPPAK